MQPCFLIASPQMKDPFFESSLVLLWHHDEDGAIGVVVNRPLESSLDEVLDPPDDVDMAPYEGRPVFWGGPVETGSGTVVTPRVVSEDEGWNLPEGISITRSLDAFMTLLRQGEALGLYLGYAGWGAGQLDTEIARGGWLVTDLDPTLLFDTPVDDRYDQALAALGLTSQTVWMTPIDE